LGQQFELKRAHGLCTASRPDETPILCAALPATRPKNPSRVFVGGIAHGGSVKLDGPVNARENNSVNVVVTQEALEEFRSLPRPIQTRVTRLVERLAQWPNVSGAKALSGRLAGHYRMRTGDYRLQFRVKVDKIVVEKIGHRDGFYG